MDNGEINFEDPRNSVARLGPRLSQDSSTRKSSVSSDSPVWDGRKPSDDTNTTLECLDEPDVKIEPSVEDVLSDSKASGPNAPTQSGEQEKLKDKSVKRPRGRPKKQPLVPQLNTEPPEFKHRGRSKTGCKTCRLRKKKCDETRPTCLNCQKSGKVCEGFPPETPHTRPSFAGFFPRTRELPVLIGGVETHTDRLLLNHFVDHLTQNLSLGEGDQNPYIKTILPMAMSHRGLMHSILFLSASHLSSLDPSVGNTIDADKADILQRQTYHYDIALNDLLQDIEQFQCNPGREADRINDAAIAQSLIFCVQANTSGSANGEYRQHLDAARHFLTRQRSSNQDFQNFFDEFFFYHEVSSSLTSLDRRATTPLKIPRFIQPEAGSYLGVFDELFTYLSQITILRDRIRERRSSNLKPHVDLQTMSEGQKIDDQLRAWSSPHTQGTPRFVASLLYRQCTWIYLYRTLLPSEPNDNLRDGVEGGLIYLRELLNPPPPSSHDGTSPIDDPNRGATTSTKAILLMPVFLLGCAAFDRSHRAELADAFQQLQEFRSSGNILQARKVVETIWEMMDNADEENSWDWEILMSRMGVDFLVA